MSAKTTLGRKAGSAIRGPRALERILIVAAIAAVLVAVGAWVAMSRPFGGAEAAGSDSSVTTTDGASADTGAGAGATDSATDASSGDQAAAPGAESSTAAPADGAAGTGSTGTGSGTGSGAGTGTGTTGGSDASAGRTSASTAPLSPTTSFLTALAASGLAPPIDDAQKIAMAEDVCQEMGYGSTYADVVRALTFAGATDAEATNFARLAITNLCSQHKIG